MMILDLAKLAYDMNHPVPPPRKVATFEYSTSIVACKQLPNGAYVTAMAIPGKPVVTQSTRTETGAMKAVFEFVHEVIKFNLAEESSNVEPV